MLKPLGEAARRLPAPRRPVPASKRPRNPQVARNAHHSAGRRHTARPSARPAVSAGLRAGTGRVAKLAGSPMNGRRISPSPSSVLSPSMPTKSPRSRLSRTLSMQSGRPRAMTSSASDGVDGVQHRIDLASVLLVHHEADASGPAACVPASGSPRSCPYGRRAAGTRCPAPAYRRRHPRHGHGCRTGRLVVQEEDAVQQAGGEDVIMPEQIRETRDAAPAPFSRKFAEAAGAASARTGRSRGRSDRAAAAPRACPDRSATQTMKRIAAVVLRSGRAIHSLGSCAGSFGVPASGPHAFSGFPIAAFIADAARQHRPVIRPRSRTWISCRRRSSGSTSVPGTDRMQELGRTDLARTPASPSNAGPKDHVQQHGAPESPGCRESDPPPSDGRLGRRVRSRWGTGWAYPDEFLRSRCKRLGGQLAGGIAGQGIDEVERAGQESRFDPLAQPRQQRFRRQIRRHDEGRQPHRAPTLAALPA